MAKPNKYSISLSLNVLNHLGINLYSNTPAVLSEVVANAWDADAENVNIELDDVRNRIIITDDGHGMTERDLNEKFLTVGYRRRENDEAVTKKHKRPVMGRKGIGKLSLFSVANTVEVHSAKGSEKSGLIMRLVDIKKAIDKKDKDKTGTYNPEEVPSSKVKIKKGTCIILTDLRKSLTKTEAFLRKRLARRFAVIGAAQKFNVEVNGDEISIKDRDYFRDLQYLWTFGKNVKEFKDNAVKKDEHEHLDDGTITYKGKKYQLRGWFGTFRSSGDAKADGNETLNKVSVLVRGKLAQEDILDEFGDAGIYASYMIGEIEADFLDLDDADDIATSSRQRLMEEDDRYQILKEYIGKHIAHVRKRWTELRNEEAEKIARTNPAIDEWYKGLGADTKHKAKAFFGKINQMTIDDKAKEKLFVHGVLAFESFRYKDKLSALETISVNDLNALSVIFADFDDIEANMYYQITKERISVIDTLRQKLDANAREKAMQTHIFKHLWLLDPMWERATDSAIMEKQVHKEFDKVTASLTADERKARLDIKYKNTAGKHVIIELKRSSVNITTEEISKQVRKYIKALQKCLDSTGRGNEPIEAVVILGKQPTDWQDSKDADLGKKMLAQFDTRVMLYDTMLDQAYRAYEQYTEKHREAGRLSKVMESLQE